MDERDVRLCPFCAHAKPIMVTIEGEEPAYVIACPECGAGAEAVTERPGAGCDRRVESAIRSGSLKRMRMTACRGDGNYRDRPIPDISTTVSPSIRGWPTVWCSSNRVLDVVSLSRQNVAAGRREGAASTPTRRAELRPARASPRSEGHRASDRASYRSCTSSGCAPPRL